jgi:hypothetical protein
VEGGFHVEAAVAGESFVSFDGATSRSAHLPPGSYVATVVAVEVVVNPTSGTTVGEPSTITTAGKLRFTIVK